MGQKVVNRVFSLEDDFMNWKTDDLLYGFLRNLSTARPTGKVVNKHEEYEEYLDVITYLNQRKIIAGICGVSVSTIGKHILSLKDKGLIKEGTRIVKYEKGTGLDKKIVDEERKCFFFPVDMTEGHSWKKIDKGMLSYLIDTRNAQCIKVYLYLLNNYHMKRNKGELFNFDYLDINAAMGYSATTKTEHVSNICKSFEREGIIRTKRIANINENAKGGYNKIDQFLLVWIAETVNDLA